MENYQSHLNYNQQHIDKVNQACYDNCADFWDRFPFPRELPEMIKSVDHRLGKRIWDIGSGTEVLAKWLSDQGYDVVCIDPSPEMVRRCRAKGLFVEMNSIQSYRPSGTFSMVFAILSLIHVPKADFPAMIQKIADTLPKGGMLFLGMLEGYEEGIFEGSEYPRFFAYYRPEEIREKVQNLFIQKNYNYFKSGGHGYMLFALEKL